MQLAKIRIKNYRLLVDAELEVDPKTTFVCCSRAKKRLFLFVTVPTDYEFKAFLMSLIGKDNIYTYSQFLEMER